MSSWRLTRHAEAVARERGIELSWIEQAILAPHWTEPDATDASLMRNFRAVVEHGNRILRVVCKESASEILVVTVFFDRDARSPL